MPIDSTQLSNILNSLKLTIEGDSLSQMQYQPLIDTLWWMWGITAFNALAFIFLTSRLWKTNKSQLKLTLREEYRDLHLLLLQLNDLSNTMLDELMVGIGSYKMDILTDKIASIMKTVNSINGLNINTLLNKQSVNNFNEIVRSLMFVRAGCIHLNRAIVNNETKYVFPIAIINFNKERRIIEISNALSYYFKGNKIISEELFMQNLMIFINLCNTYKLHKVTEKFCNIYNLTK